MEGQVPACRTSQGCQCCVSRFRQQMELEGKRMFYQKVHLLEIQSPVPMDCKLNNNSKLRTSNTFYRSQFSSTRNNLSQLKCHLFFFCPVGTVRTLIFFGHNQTGSVSFPEQEQTAMANYFILLWYTLNVSVQLQTSQASLITDYKEVII